MKEFKELPEEVQELWQVATPATNKAARYCESLLDEIATLKVLLSEKQETIDALINT